jgi:hypothetical protein
VQSSPASEGPPRQLTNPDGPLTCRYIRGQVNRSNATRSCGRRLRYHHPQALLACDKFGDSRGDGGPREANGAIIDSMDIAPFNAPVSAKGRAKVIKIRDGTEVAARYFVYKLYEANGGQPMQWCVLHGMGESAATISRAVERGWVVLQAGGKPLERKAALTDEGRRLARKGR